jgi:hypothetical protein
MAVDISAIGFSIRNQAKNVFLVWTGFQDDMIIVEILCFV